jgi:polysaccharide pyruvyl transferase CsaB
MKTVISGYYGFDNVGDEAVLKCIIHGLKKRGVEDITVLSNKPVETSRKYKVKAVNRNSFKEIFQAIRKADVVLSGGGSLIQDKTSSRSLWYYIGIMMLGKLLGKKVYVIGQGVGPVEKKFNKWLTAFVLNRVDGIAVRDPFSYDFLKRELKINKEVEITADFALGLPFGEVEDRVFEKIHDREGIDLLSQEYFLICPREWGNFELSRVELARAVDFIAEEYGYKAVFLPFYREDIEESDRIATYMKIPAEILTEKYDLEEILAIIKRSQFLIGIRLHSLIFAFISLVPFVGISYDPKIDGFLHLIGEKSVGDVNSFTAEAIIEKIRGIMKNKEEYINKLAINLEDLKKKAEKNFEIIFK